MRSLKVSLIGILLILLKSLYPLPEEGPRHNDHTSGSPERVERVLIHLENIPQGSNLYPGSNGLIRLEGRRFRQESGTLDAIAGFYEVPARKGYKVTALHKSSSKAFNEPMELWGIWNDVDITNANNEFTFVREMPYILDIHSTYNRRNAIIPSMVVGDEVTFRVYMNNPSQDSYRAMVTLNLKNTGTNQVFQISEETTLPAGAMRESLTMKLTVTEAGEYLIAPGIFVKNRINQWTDCWDWSDEPELFVTARQRELQFAGYNWDVKAGFGNPGSNLWSDDPSDVWVDGSGRLHLTLGMKENGRWYATEIISRETFDYGTYTFFIEAEPEKYDPHVVAGIFLYRDEQNEIDIEFSRWGDQDNYQFGNYVIQPADVEGNHFRFPIFSSGTHTTHRIVWKPGEVNFSSWHGHHSKPPDERYIAQWQYKGAHVPEPNALRLFFNIWLFRGITPKNDNTEKLIVTNFTYNPLKIE